MAYVRSRGQDGQAQTSMRLLQEEIRLLVFLERPKKRTRMSNNSGNINGDKESEEIEIQRIDEAEFRNRKAHSLSKNKEEETVNTTDSVGLSTPHRRGRGRPKKRSPLKSTSRVFGPSNSLGYNYGDTESKDYKTESIDETDSEIEWIDEKEFRNEKPHFEGTSSKQEINEVQSESDDGTDIEVEILDECHFRNIKTYYGSQIGPSGKQKLNEGQSGAVQGKNVDSRRKKISSVSNDSDSSDDFDQGWLHKSGSFEQEGNNEEDTDSDMIVVEKLDEAEFRNNRTKAPDGFLDSPDESDSSSSDTVSDSSDDDFWKNSYIKEVLRSHVEKYDVQNNKSMEVSAEKNEDFNKQKGILVNRTTRKRSFSNHQDEEKDCNQPALPREKFSLRNKQFSNNGSSKQTNGKKIYKSDNKEVLGRNVEKNDGQNNKSIKVSAEEIGDCNKQKGILVNCTTKRRISNNQDEEKDCNLPALPKHKYSLRNKRFSNNGSNKQTNGHKTSEMNEVHEQNGEMNKILDNDDNSEECFKEKRDEKNEKCYCGDDDIQKPFDSTSSDSHVNCETEKITVPDEIEKPTKRKQVASKHHDFCQMLADSVLEKGPTLATKESDEQAKQAPISQAKNTLPLKFRFEDEVPKVVEKTEFQKEMDGLFTEMDFDLAMDELGSVNYPEVVQENQTDPAEETQRDRCTRGKHELELKDDEGIICIHCGYVEIGPKDVMPQWADTTYRESRRKRYSEKEQLSDLGEFHLQSSADSIADFRNCPKGTVWNIKPGVRESMYEHQQEGFEFLWKNLAGSINLNELNSTDPGGVGGCIISHAPGTGKTRLTIVFIETYLRFFPKCRPVIIAPASMLLTWEEEFRKWNVDFPFYNINSLEFTGKENKTALRVLVGSKRENKDTIRMVKIYSWNAGGSILGISYSLFEKLTGEKYTRDETGEKRESVNIDDKMKFMRKILLEKPGLVILDEGHTPRNKRSNIWNALLKLHTQKRVVLSGTPFQNNFEELFNMFRIVRPAIAEVLVQEREFAEMITSRRRKYKGRNQQSISISEVNDHSVEKLKLSMSPFVHVHKGTILQQSLPGLKDCVVLLKPSPLQKSLIERLEGSPSSFQFEHQVALISVHPYLFKYCDSTEEQRKGIDLNAVKASKLNPNLGAKTKFIIELVHISMALKEKVLIFSQYIQPLRLLNEQLKEIFKWGGGKHILQMEGKLDQNQRQSLINQFNDPLHESKVMLASTRCCSEGISLVGASRVVLLDVVWNPSVERQAIRRAYRIGQKKFVYTYHLMTSGTTEADKYCRQAEKERLSDLVFTSSSNEGSKEKHPSGGIEDMILEKMVDNEKLKDMFEKIINQPKDTNLIQTFGLTVS